MTQHSLYCSPDRSGLVYTHTLSNCFLSPGPCLTCSISSTGKDLRSVQTLQRKHEGLERDLAALGDKIRQLDDAANRLIQTHPDQSDAIYQKQREINQQWTQLTGKANTRKEKLLDSYDLHRFLSDYRDLMSWVNTSRSLVASDELAQDVTGAEALLERHQVRAAAGRPHCRQTQTGVGETGGRRENRLGYWGTGSRLGRRLEVAERSNSKRSNSERSNSQRLDTERSISDS